MKRSRILEAWNELAAMVLPPHCSRLQRIESRRMFYAGAAAALQVVDAAAECTDEKDATEILKGLVEELDKFSEDIRKGEA